MANFEFSIIASGLDPEADDFEDRFYEAGCDDATIGFQKGAIVLDFDREARTLISAMVSAIRDVRRAGAQVNHIEPDYLVNANEIAARSNYSKAAVSLYAKGERGSEFPAPVARVTTESPLWDWVEVAHWLYIRNKIDRFTAVSARVTKVVSEAISKTPTRGKSTSPKRVRRVRKKLDSDKNLAA